MTPLQYGEQIGAVQKAVGEARQPVEDEKGGSA